MKSAMKSAMKCTRCGERLDELVREELPAGQASEMREHLRGCTDCAGRLEQTRATLSLLGRLGEEPLPADFSSSLHRRLASTPAPSPSGWLGRLRALLSDHSGARSVMLGAVGAAAVVALLVGARTLLRVNGSVGSAGAELASGGDVAPTFIVPRTKIAVVRIDFVAEQIVEDVEFAIALPEGLHFVSEGRELPDREFRWRGRLERGSNPIPVAVRGARAGRYTVAARAVASDLNATHNVVLEVTAS